MPKFGPAKKLLSLIACLTAIISAPAQADNPAATQPSIYVNHRGLLKLNWQLACVGSTFKDRSTFEMIDLLHSLNFHHIELSTEQFGDLDAAGTDALLAKLKSVHMDVVSAGPLDFGSAEADARAIFVVAKTLKLKTIVLYPADRSLPMLDKLANEYQINIAVRNRVKPQDHWDPDELGAAIAGLSNRIGVCADVSAWRDSGLSPTEAVQKLKGHILTVHLRDFDSADAAQVLAELKGQKFKGICALECPTGDHLLDRFTQEVTTFSKIVGDLSGLP